MKTLPIEFRLNGRDERLDIPASALMLDVLRDQFGLTGAKRSCDVQVCGSCTLLVNGRPVSSCTTLAAEMDGAEILTIEGLASGWDDLHPMQRAFVETGGLQCGFCTPGFILTALFLIQDGTTDEAKLREGLDGNICRCTGYSKIIEAVKSAAATSAAG